MLVTAQLKNNSTDLRLHGSECLEQLKPLNLKGFKDFRVMKDRFSFHCDEDKPELHKVVGFNLKHKNGLDHLCNPKDRHRMFYWKRKRD